MQEMKKQNELFPIFLKMENLRLLIVGGGYVGLEKLNAVLENSPSTKIRLVGIDISQSIFDLASQHNTLTLEEKAFESSDLNTADIVIIAINDKVVSKAIHEIVKSQGKLVNVADKPELCDFYLGSIVQKGNLKIAISTNGQSPTIAKRLKEVFTDALPQEIDDLLDQMHLIRNKLKGDFTEKVIQLNALTKGLVEKQ